MIIESLVAALVVAKIRGGNIKNIGKISISHWYLFLIAFVIKYSAILLGKFLEGKVAGFIQNNYNYINIVVFTLLIIGLLLNIKNKGIIIILVGSILNFIVILLNGGKMPISQSISFLPFTHTLINEYTRCHYLADIIPIPYFIPKIISIGDIIIGVGIFLLVQQVASIKNYRGKVLDFTYKSNL